VYTIHHPPHSAGNRPKNKQHRCGMYAEKWECIPIRGRGNCACPVRNMIEHVASMCINSGGSTKPRMTSFPHASSSFIAVIFTRRAAQSSDRGPPARQPLASCRHYQDTEFGSRLQRHETATRLAPAKSTMQLPPDEPE
jgi:hypothetical protein